MCQVNKCFQSFLCYKRKDVITMGLNLGTDALPWSVRNLEPPLSDGRRVLRAELDELDNEIAQVQARGGLLFSPGDTGLTP